jgi:hypothetical protein
LSGTKDTLDSQPMRSGTCALPLRAARSALAALVDRIRTAWTADEVVAARVDSLAVRIEAAA